MLAFKSVLTLPCPLLVTPRPPRTGARRGTSRRTQSRPRTRPWPSARPRRPLRGGRRPGSGRPRAGSWGLCQSLTNESGWWNAGRRGCGMRGERGGEKNVYRGDIAPLALMTRCQGTVSWLKRDEGSVGRCLRQMPTWRGRSAGRALVGGL